MPDAENPTFEILQALRSDASAVKDKVIDIERHVVQLRMRQRFDRLGATLAEVFTQLQIHGTHISRLMQQESFASSKMAELEVRLARVEKRLELRDK